jgi:hypothetical protein
MGQHGPLSPLFEGLNPELEVGVGLKVLSEGPFSG